MDLILRGGGVPLPLSQCSQILCGMLFANATTTSHRATGVHLFDYIRPAAGFGLRLMFSKHVRTNINFEMGFGFKSSGVYFSGAETF